MAEGESKAQEVIEFWQRSVNARSNVRTVVLDERAFAWRLDHYQDETPGQPRDKNAVKPRGRQSFSKLRHKIGRIASSPVSIDLRPASRRATPELDEVATTVVEGLISDPQTRYRPTRRKLVSTALASRAGAMTWHVTYMANGEPRITARFEDPLNIHWSSGFTDPCDPECPVVLFDRVVSVDALLAMNGKQGWKVPLDLKPDADGAASEGDGRSARSDTLQGSGGAAGGLMVDYGQEDGVRIGLCWYRNDASKKYIKGAESVSLDPKEQYLACPECGWRSEAGKQDSAWPGGLPPVTMCPECNATAKLVTEAAVLESQIAYPNGRLVVVALHQSLTFYDDKWPWKMRDVPLLWFPCYEDPFAQWGISDTTLDRDEQCAINAISRKMFLATMQSGAVIITTDDLTQPNSREPFEFNDDPVSLAIWRGQGAPTVEVFKPDPIASGEMGLLQYLNNDFRVDAGTSDLGIQGKELKQVTATAASIAFQTGEIPVDDHIAQLQEREGTFFGIAFDIWRSLHEARTSVPVSLDGGRTEWIEVRGSDLEDYQFIVTSGADFKQLDTQRADAARQLMQVPPEDRGWFAEAMGFPVSVLRKLEKAERLKQLMAERARQNAITAQGGGPATNGAPAPAGPAPMNGPTIPPAMMQRMGQGVPGLSR